MVEEVTEDNVGKGTADMDAPFFTGYFFGELPGDAGGTNMDFGPSPLGEADANFSVSEETLRGVGSAGRSARAMAGIMLQVSHS